jgi:2-oxoglutarate dehydrogenase E2 component (dihydrolipoamide succinyltransferase)
MSSIANLSSAPSALSSITAHTHGHKKGSRVESTSTSSDSDGDAMTPVPAGTQQNLFSSMLQSLEQVIGIQPATAATASAAAPAVASVATPAAGTASGSAAAAAPASPASAAATASSSSALQKYLHNVSSQTNDVRFPTVVGFNVSASA